MDDDEQLQRELTRVALTALEGRAFALAGSGAVGCLYVHVIAV